MNGLNNVKVGVKLVGGFVLIALIILLVAGAIAYPFITGKRLPE